MAGLSVLHNISLDGAPLVFGGGGSSDELMSIYCSSIVKCRRERERAYRTGGIIEGVCLAD